MCVCVCGVFDIQLGKKNGDQIILADFEGFSCKLATFFFANIICPTLNRGGTSVEYGLNVCKG